MKKLLFLLLLSVSGYSQAVFDEGIQITGGQTTTSTTSKILSQESDGIVNTIDAANLPLSTATENALFAKKDATSTAVTSTATLTNNGATFTLSPLTGVIVDNSTVPSTRTVINFAGASNVTPLYFRTLLYIDNTGTLQQMNGASTDLTPQQKVDNLFIGIVVYSGGTVQVVQLIPNIEYGIDNRFSVLTDFLRNINEGNNIGANGANLQVNKGAGYTFRRGSNFATNREVPDVTTDAAQTPIPASPNLIGYRNGSGGWTYEPYTGITPQFWDNGTGVKATVANNKFTNVRDYFFNGTNTHVFYLGRTEHATLEAAATAAQNPDAIVDPATSVGSLIGTISVAYNATALNNTAQARFTQGPRMQGGTGAGGASGSQNLQNTYLNSSVPQITTTALGAVTVQEGTGNDANNIYVGKNNAGTTTFSVSGAGTSKARVLELANNPIGSVSNEIKQTIGADDWWKIYGKTDVSDKSEMVFEVGDNAQPFDDNGQRFVFKYNNLDSGISKNPLIIDYDAILADANIEAKSFKKTGGTSSQFLKGDGSVDTTVYQPLISNNITGTGISGRTAVFSSSNILTSGLIEDNGSFVNIISQNNSKSCSHTGATTGYTFNEILNSGGRLVYGLEGSVGGVSFTGAQPYYSYIGGFEPSKGFHVVSGNSLSSTFLPNGDVEFYHNISATTYTGGATLINTPTAPTAPVGTNTTQIATMAAVQTAITNNGIITTATNITNATLTDTSLPQNGKTLLISNGATNINYTVNAGITASFVKGGTGSITFVQGSGRTIVAANGTLVFNGAQYSTASVVSFGTTDIVYINNF